MNNNLKGLLLALMLVLMGACNSSNKDITAFSISGTNGTINDISITVALPAGTNVTSLTPTITISDDATVSPASGSAKDFTTPVIYTVTAENETTKQYVVMVTTGSSPAPSNLCTSSTHPTTTFESGSGSKADPYIICTATQLNLIGATGHTELFSKSYKLGADINMSGITLNPIGNMDDAIGFNGIFDGNNYKISNLTINTPTNNYVGFISYLSLGGEVKNLGLEDVNISGQTYVAGLVASSERGAIGNCYVTGNISGTSYVGGLVGYNYDSSISSSYTTGTVTGIGSGQQHTGGLVGYNDGANLIINSYSTCSVSGDLNVGGLVGINNAKITNSMASGSVTFTGTAPNLKWRIGGLVGDTDSSSIIYGCYATGAVTGGDSTGGLTGETEGYIQHSYATGTVIGADDTGGFSGNSNTGYILDSYATGSVTGANKVGGFVGNNSGGIERSYSFGATTGTGSDVGGLAGYKSIIIVNCGTDSFWNTETSTQATSPCGIGKTTAEMHQVTTYTGMSWDLDYVWSMTTSDCTSYPSTPSPYLYPCIRSLAFVCFTGDTLITMVDGKTKRIDEIKKGEKIRSFDDKTKISTSIVESVKTREVNKYLVIKTSDNRIIKATPEHPFYSGSSTKAEFKPIKEFKVGDTLYVNSNHELTKVKITSITESKDKIKVYNLHNDNSGPHTFFANGFAVHNK